jgi:hypothetical protein
MPRKHLARASCFGRLAASPPRPEMDRSALALHVLFGLIKT